MAGPHLASPRFSLYFCSIILIDLYDSGTSGSGIFNSDVAHMKTIALCHIFIDYSLESVLMTMHMVKCTTKKPFCSVLFLNNMICRCHARVGTGNKVHCLIDQSGKVQLLKVSSCYCVNAM